MRIFGKLCKNKRLAAALGAATLAIAGCGASSSPNGSGGTDSAAAGSDVKISDTATKGDTAGNGDSGAKGDAAGTPPDVEDPKPQEDFWVIYSHVPRIPGSTDSVDYVLSGSVNPSAAGAPGKFKAGISPLDKTQPALELTKVAFKNAGTYNCAYGCFISADLQYMAVATGPADATGHYTYALGTVAPDLTVKIGKFGTLKDVKHLVFSGKYLFYSQKAKCLGTGKCQYDIHRQGPFGAENFEDLILTRMAPDNDEDVIEGDTIYEGYFRVSGDSSTVMFLTPTIRSTKLYTWRAGSVSKVDYICPNFDGVKCVGTGSEYRDNDAAALSPDGKIVVLFSIWDRWLRVRKYVVGSEEPGVFANLVEVPGTPYKQKVCGVLTDKQHAEVKFEPWFSADGATIYFVGFSNCAGSSNKIWTDIMSLPVDKIGPALTPADWTNWTQQPRDNSSKNKVIEWLSMSPSRKFFVMSASAAVTEQGQPIPDGQARTMQDTEIYTMPVGGKVMTPVTNENAWHARQPVAIPPLAAP